MWKTFEELESCDKNGLVSISSEIMDVENPVCTKDKQEIAMRCGEECITGCKYFGWAVLMPG